MTTISNVSRRMEETGDLLERAITVMFLAAVVVVIGCVMVLAAAFTFAALHNGDDFDYNGFGTTSGPVEGDIIVLPAQLL
jgi:hypothetical protein